MLHSLIFLTRNAARYFIAERSTGVFDHATTDSKEHGKSAAHRFMRFEFLVSLHKPPQIKRNAGRAVVVKNLPANKLQCRAGAVTSDV